MHYDDSEVTLIITEGNITKSWCELNALHSLCAVHPYYAVSDRVCQVCVQIKHLPYTPSPCVMILGKPRFIMNFSDINSVSDLINANNKEKVGEDLITKLTKPVYAEEPVVGMQVAISLLTELLALHEGVMNEAIEENETMMAVNWAMDTARIDEAITILKEIQM